MSTTNDHIDADAFVHGLLDMTDFVRVEAHCETCTACKQAVEDARKRLAVLQAVPPTEAPPHLVETTMRHLNESLRRRVRLKKRVLGIFLCVSAVAASILFGVHLYIRVMKVSPYDLAVYGQNNLVSATSASLRVRLINHTTMGPVAGAPVTIELDQYGRTRQLATFTTDSTGSGEPTFKLPDETGDFTLTVRAQTPGGEEIVTRPVQIRRTWKVMLSTDKPVYQPGHVIHIRALALRSLDQLPAKELPAVFRLTDPKGTLLFKHDGKTSKFGIAATDCELATEILEGAYTLSCKIGDTESRQVVEVKKYVLPKFKIEVKLDRPYYRPQEKAKVVVQADYFFGKPVADAEVLVEVRRASSDKTLHEDKVRTDAKGRAVFEYTMPAEDCEPVQFAVGVTDAGGQKQSTTIARLVTQETVRIDIVPENGKLVPNVPNTIYVLTTRVDGLPLSLRVKVGEYDEIHTDTLGAGSFVMTPLTSYKREWHVSARDDQGTLLASQEVKVYPAPDSLDFLLQTDKAVYRAGDTMQITIRATDDQPRYLDILKDGQTLLTRAVEVRQGTGTLSVDLPPDLFGTLELRGYRFNGEDAVGFRTRIVYVHPPGELKIATTLDHDEYRPGGAAKINFHVTDAEGGAAPGVLSIAAVDEAVFAVMAQRPGRETHFYTVDDRLLAAAYKLRPWSPDAEPAGDEESRQRLQQAIFAAAASGETPSRSTFNSDDEAPKNSGANRLGSVSSGDTAFRRKAEAFETKRERWLENVCVAWYVVMSIILLAGYTSLWVFVDRKITVLLHVSILMVAVPTFVSLVVHLGGSANNTFSYVGSKVGSGGDQWSTGYRPSGLPPANGKSDKKGEEGDDRSSIQAGENGYAKGVFNAGGFGGRASNSPRLRDYFPETLEWKPQLVTDDDGRASLDLTLADSITTWRLSASAVTADGRLGATEKPMKVFQPFFVDVNLPVSLTRGDEIAMPVVVYNYLDKPQTVVLSLTKAPWFTLLDDADQRVELAAGQVRSISYRIRVEKAGDKQELTVTARAGDIGDAVKRLIEVVPDGRRVEVVHNGTLDPSITEELSLPKNAIDGSCHALVKIYPSGFSEVVEGLDGIFQIPHGCFEQTSSTTYPSVLALDYLQRTKQPARAVEKKAREYIHLGYQRLLSFEVSGGGFDWFGNAPGNVQLTAYGLMEFQDMARVHAVDPDLIQRTRSWLLRQRRDDGSWLPTDHGHGHFDADQLRLTAYVAWAVFDDSQARQQSGPTRRFLLQQPAERFEDSYALALVCNALLAIDPSGQDAAAYVERLETLKHMDKNGQQASWSLAKDKRTLYYGQGEGGTVETTALAALAFIKDNRHPTTARLALAWLAAHKDAHGTWRSTQATVLALKALLAGTTPFGGDKERRFVIQFGDKFTEEHVIKANQADVLHMIDLSKQLTAEPQKLTIRETTGTQSTYQIAFRYHEPLTLAAAEERPLKVEMKFDKQTVQIGDTITATATMTNRTGQAAPMVMLELPIPVGCSLSGDDFAQLVVKKTIAKYERTPRGVLVYLTELDKDLTLTYHLQATTPARGTTTPARVYEYYNPQQEGRSEQAVLVVK